MLLRQFLVMLFGFVLSISAAHAQQNSTIALPANLHSLYTAYPHLHETLGQYAASQGFSGPYERVATILHELIHIDSAVHGSYQIQGVGYAPYNQPSAWPTYRFLQFRDAVSRPKSVDTQEIVNTPIFRLYVANIPNNTLASLADELNAYAQSTNWLCQTVKSNSNERTKSAQSMRDMLRVTNLFLQTLRTEAPTEFVALYRSQRPARNLLALTIINAAESLAMCGMTLQSRDRNELDQIVKIARDEAKRAG